MAKNPELSRGIVRRTLAFMVAMTGLTILAFLGLALILITVPNQTMLTDYVPFKATQDPASLSWDPIYEVGGRGYVLDPAGVLIQAYPQDDSLAQAWKPGTPYDLLLTRSQDQTTFVYRTPQGGHLLLVYPQTIFTNQPTFNLNSVTGPRSKVLLALLVGLFLAYAYGFYRLIRRLSVRLRADLKVMQDKEEAGKRIFFQGLAHDIKTPLSTIMAYAKAGQDGALPPDKTQEANRLIYQKSLLLRDRVEAMVTFAGLEDAYAKDRREADILECLRQTLAENYLFLQDQGASLRVDIPEKAAYRASFSPALLGRLMENLLSNAVRHNPPGVEISLAWDLDHQTLRLWDSGPGIPRDLWETMWDPMVTGDPSRAGEGLGGMGLANVKRIADLHAWEITYDGSFWICFGPGKMSPYA